MDLVSGIVVYICLWWISFFVLLPFGIEQEKHPELGNDLGAPKKTYLFVKTLLTTGIATVAWFFLNYLISRYI